jgi:ElaB/YqjD/DUF883 family membrane-anchored ribosome-binding protein
MADTTPSPSGRTASGALSRDEALALAMDFGTELLGAVRDSATALVDEQRHRAANEIGAFGEVLRRSGQALDQLGATAVSRYTDESGRQISQFADRLRQRSLAGLTADFEDFVRRWPFPSIAAAIGIGFLAGRFLVSSAPDRATRNPAETRQFTRPRAVPRGEVPGAAREDDRAVLGSPTPGSSAGSG